MGRAGTNQRELYVCNSVKAAVAAVLRGGLVLCTATACVACLGSGGVGHQMHNTSATRITVNGTHRGAVFDGIGAISGGGGDSRFLIDYPAMQRSQILNYLFGPGGADLQLLKLEIGGDANSSDGSEPSIEHSRGHVDCQSGYEWWLAKQAVARNPHIKLYGLQWAAPGWVGSVWSHADANYVIEWLDCARSHGLTISYLGGWDERGYNIAWYEYLRSRLDASGYGSVKIVVADARPRSDPWALRSDPWNARADPRTAWLVAVAAADHPAFRNAINIVGVHDTCGWPTNGYRCESTSAARRLGLPLWESELGGLNANTGAPDMARSINNGFIQARITGYLEWPLMESMPAGLPYEDRGLVTADQPQSGSYAVNEMTWAIAQTTQFVKPGWRHVYGANAELGNSGSYDAYESPNGRAWSLVVENTGHSLGQQIGPRTIHVRLTGGLSQRIVRVWATNLMSADPLTWFVRQPDIRPDGGAFSYSVPPGDVVSFTSVGGQSHYLTTPPLAAPMKLPYRAYPDGSDEAWGLATEEGAFIYRPCFGATGGECIEQMAGQRPVWWQKPSGRPGSPYAIVGDPGWSNYTVSTKVLFPTSAGAVRLIARFQSGGDMGLFGGYAFNLKADGNWEIARASRFAKTAVLADGKIPPVRPGTWHAVAFTLHGNVLTGSVGGRRVGQVRNRKWASGLAGIGSSWNVLQFKGLSVTPFRASHLRRHIHHR
jgi:O-glycosyl hydrolase